MEGLEEEETSPAAVMACIWEDRLLQLHPDQTQNLPAAARSRLETGTNSQFLDTLAQLALDPAYTDAVFAAYESLFVELCSRWMLHIDTVSLQILAALARLLPYASHLSIRARQIVLSRRGDELGAMFHVDDAAVLQLPERQLVSLLATMSRLLEYDHHSFRDAAPLPKLQILFSAGSPAVKYLSARVMGQVLGFSETSAASIGKTAVGDQSPLGLFEGIEINFQFFSLWEIKRQKQMRELLQRHRATHQLDDSYNSCLSRDEPMAVRRILLNDLSESTVYLGGHLSPRQGTSKPSVSSVVLTQSTKSSLRAAAEALDEPKPVLVTGLPGSGKTMVINEIASQLGRLHNMLILHLNEQTDAKLLVGVYTSDAKPGSFRWQPGVLTTAVKEGRWIFIEDIDRAPAEVLGVLLPLLERNELLVPNLGGYIKAAEGFKIVASKRTSLNTRGEEVVANERQIGHSLWNTVHLKHPSRADLSQVIHERHPLLQQKKEVMDIYQVLLERNTNTPVANRARGSPRTVGIQEIFRFCSRYEALLSANGVKTASDPVPESLYDIILVEAVDCFCAADEDLAARDSMASLLAAKLQISPERAEFCLYQRVPDFKPTENHVQIGRTRLTKERNRSSAKSRVANTQQKFASTGPVLRLMESVAVAVQMQEPCLLVGETGVGKTTVVQQLASQLGKSLMVTNLSQQSEVSDLLGSIKPVSARALAVPLKEHFDDLFAKAQLSNQNATFTKSMERAFHKDDWPRMISLMRKALDSIRSFLDTLNKRSEEAPKKKRRLEPSEHDSLKNEWDSFASRLDAFKRHVAMGDKGLIFDFIEGNLVKAVRSGGWVLLDEINLASPDTLECISDLLSQGPNTRPFLLLSDTGNVEKIVAHPDFRIFGAMNPATDIGKRDLPPSIRSRFTEYYVHSPDQDPGSLRDIVSAYLSDINSNLEQKRHLSQACVELYTKIRALETDNQLVDGAGQRPHFTLRTLTRTLTFATDVTPSYGIKTGLYHGFATCFLTVLDAESKKSVSRIIDQYILNNPGRSFVQRPVRQPDGGSYVSVENYWIRQGDASPVVQEHYILTEHVTANLQSLARATMTRRYPILLQGPTSSGKTSLIEYLAKRSGNRFVRINNHEHTDLQEYLGSYVSTPNGLVYQDGVLVEALRRGYWVVLDELNLAPTDVLEALNRLLDDNRELMVPETQEIVRPHTNFMLFATQNPPGMYGGRKVLSRAFRNRFLELHFNEVPEDELEKILKRRCPNVPESFCSRIVQVYRKLALLRQSERMFEQKNSFATLRDLFRWAWRDATDRQELAVNGFMLLAERVRDTKERLAVKRVIEEVMKETIDIDHIYDNASLGHGETSPLAWSEDEILWTKSAKRLYILIKKALEHEEPVLLVGDTGCGKTKICQVLASHDGRKLNIVNAHQNTETGDLIGSQRPIRDRSLLEAKLKNTMEQIASTGGHTEFSSSSFSLKDSLKYLDDMPSDIRSAIPLELMTSIEATRAKINMLFEWCDGSLVTAMKQGEYFMLDEISLADDSVLERLNSVLEPERSVLLAEKGSVDSAVVASQSFRFLATMNPGGDYGKKELSPALRNRFTEIWVPGLSPHDDIEPILKAKLPTDIRKFVPPMLEFATWFSEAFGDGAQDLSIRDILAWADFVIASNLMLDPIPAVIHGALMVYVDGLGANPSARFSATHQSITEQRTRCLRRLGEALHYDISDSNVFNLELVSQPSLFGIGPFVVHRDEKQSSATTFNFQARTTLANGLRLLRALQLTKPILLEGSPGVGKTALVTALAEVLGRPLTRINLSDQTDIMDLFGSDVPMGDGNAGHFIWRDAPFLQAMVGGEWVLLDEMNLASQSVLEGLNACLDHRGEVYVPELGRSFKKHDDFTLFAAQNPHSQGGGRKGLPASFVNRFTVVYADALTDADYNAICQGDSEIQAAGTMGKMVKQVVAAQNLTSSTSFAGGPWEFNLRDLLRWISLHQDSRHLIANADWTDFEQMLFYGRLRAPADVTSLKGMFKSLNQDDDARHCYYRNVGENWYQCGFGLLVSSGLRSDRQNSPSILPPAAALESVMISIQKAWPVLLVGPTGSGKSALVAHLASMTGKELLKLNLNPDTDAFDLIGGYQQADLNRDIASLFSKIKQLVLQEALSTLQRSQTDRIPLLSSIFVYSLKPTRASLPIMLDLLKSLDQQTRLAEIDDLSETCARLIARIPGEAKAQFEWVDGILVTALKEGSWIELENANMCASSVLDRLNALLEPGGSLVIHEHTKDDGSPQHVVPHPRFRLFLTMDARHGELSRAMRNRCVEVCLELTTKASDSVPRVSLAADLFRYQAFQSLDWSSLNGMEFSEQVRICLDNLSPRDFGKILSWREEIHKGMVKLTPQQLKQFDQLFQSFNQLMSSENEVRNAIGVVMEKRTLSLSGPLQDLQFTPYQPIHPFANPPLLSKGEITMTSQNELLIWVGTTVELAIDMLVSTLRLLEPTNSSLGRQRPGSRSIELRQTVRETVTGVLGWLNTSISLTLSRNDANTVRQICGILANVADLFKATHFELAKLQTLWRLGSSLVSNGNHSELLTDLVAFWKSQLGRLQAGMHLSTGGSMDILWQLLKPHHPKDLSAISFCSEVQKLADEFDLAVWRSNIPLEQIVQLRGSLRLVMHEEQSQQWESRLGKLRETLYEDQQSNVYLDEPIYPHFRGEFEGILQYRYLSGSATGELLDLDTLAGRNTRDALDNRADTNSAKLMLNLRKMSGIDTDHTKLITLRQDLPMRILRRLGDIQQTSIGSMTVTVEELTRLGKEVTVMTEALTKNSLSLMDKRLIMLHSTVLSAHAGDSHGAPKDVTDEVQRLLSAVADVDLSVPLDSSDTLVFDKTQYQSVLEKYMLPSLRALVSKANVVPIQRDLFRSSFAWMRFFAALLFLYVPDVPYDPSSTASLRLELWSQARDRAHARRAALKRYEEHLTGEESNYRSRLQDSDINALDTPPSTPHVVRPEKSRMGQLHTEMVNVIKSILHPVQGLLGKDYKDQDYLTDEDMEHVSVIRQNLSHVIQRLNGQFVEYEDLVSPLISMLQGLDIGFELARITYHARNCATGSREVSAFGLMFPNQEAVTRPPVDRGQQNPASPHISTIKYLALQARILAITPTDYSEEIQDEFEALFLIWQRQLKQEQEQHAARSSLYRYTGATDQSDEHDEAELFELFLTGDSQQSAASPSGKLDASNLAATVTELQDKFTTGDQTLASLLEELVRSSAWDMASAYENLPSVLLSTPPSKHIPVLLLEISAKKQGLHLSSGNSQQLDFYHDFNASETSRLRQLLFRIHERFLQLRQSWPEHAAIGDVIDAARKILQLDLSQPLTKLLAQAEWLHGLVNEWQGVASREYSASGVYDALTTLLIDWRRLELATWPSLLDFEDVKCVKEAQSWWFVAYELMIHAPVHISDEAALASYLERMMMELQRFISTTSCGLFPHRLRLLNGFIRYIQLLSSHLPKLASLVGPLLNLLHYYRRYQGKVRDIIESGRKQIAKDMDEVILLAKWKDTNIRALRESAVKSHRKILKVIRKYRVLLGQSVERIVVDPCSHTDIYDTIKIDHCIPQGQSLGTMTSFLARHYEGWNGMPKRFTEASATGDRVRGLHLLPQVTVDSIDFLAEFSSDLLRDVAILKKETPSVKTKENEALIKQVKTRKRVLFAQVLKGLREMGFQANVDAKTLAGQQDLSRVLIKSDGDQRLLGSAPHFFTFLSNMDQVRVSIQGHSEDLTDQEVNRSLGLLESILRTLLSQRQSMGNFSRQIDAIDETLDRLVGLQEQCIRDPEGLILTRKAEDASAERRLAWFGAVLEFASKILEQHEQLGASHFPTVRSGLLDHAKTVTELRHKIADSSKMPPGLETDLHTKILEKVDQATAALTSDLKSWGENEPSIKYLTNEVNDCLQITAPAHDASQSSPKSSRTSPEGGNESTLPSLMAYIDGLLKKVQRVGSMTQGIELSVGDHNWLVTMNRCFSDLATAYDLNESAEKLQSVLSRLQDAQKDRLSTEAAFCVLQVPVIIEYRHAAGVLADCWYRSHRSLCEAANTLAEIFKTMLTQGFCLPSEKSNDKAEPGDLEDGTGLGEGEGAEDISKDIEQDEDLSELAQQKPEEAKEQEIDAEKDAVDMADEELEATAEDNEQGENDEDKNDGDDSAEDDRDDEVGSIDSREDDAVDEKFWDGEKDEQQDTKTTDKNQKGKQDDEMAAGQAEEEPEAGEAEPDEANEDDPTHDEDAKDERDLDQFAEAGENLDLPDDMEIDGNNDDAMSDDSALDDVSEKDMNDEEKVDENGEGEDVQQQPPEADMATETEDIDETRSVVDAEAGQESGEEMEDQEDPQLMPEEQMEQGGDAMDEVEEVGTAQRKSGLEGAEKDQVSDQEDEAEAPGREDAVDTDMQEDGTGGEGKAEAGDSSKDQANEVPEMEIQPYKRLGDAFERWHRLNQDIKDASQEERQDLHEEEEIGEDQEFEHLPDDDAAADTQALGKATEDQVTAFDQQAIDAGIDQDRKAPIMEEDEDCASDADQPMEDLLDDPQTQSNEMKEEDSTNLVQDMMKMDPSLTGKRRVDVEPADEETDMNHEAETDETETPLRELDDARRIWTHCEAATRDLALSLTEQLRLILAPTQASKLRGDFRTGKRLNIKRIIPYIASQYKRDKIWMRRSVPSKRSYQVLLAVDDSSSMSRGSGGRLALESLALISRSLSMLEVGQICILGFGSDVRIAHPFDQPFSSEAGVRAFQQFSFSQSKTDVKKLVNSSLEIFREARAMATYGSADLWQLQLIISDGICDDRDQIRRMVRQAQEERVMTVFVIIDALKEESILQMQEAAFVADEDGNQRPLVSRYLDNFPFPVYLIVQNVKDLPNVLAMALRQWFAEVAER